MICEWYKCANFPQRTLRLVRTKYLFACNRPWYISHTWAMQLSKPSRAQMRAPRRTNCCEEGIWLYLVLLESESSAEVCAKSRIAVAVNLKHISMPCQIWGGKVCCMLALHVDTHAHDGSQSMRERWYFSWSWRAWVLFKERLLLFVI